MPKTGSFFCGLVILAVVVVASFYSMDMIKEMFDHWKQH